MNFTSTWFLTLSKYFYHNITSNLNNFGTFIVQGIINMSQTNISQVYKGLMLGVYEHKWTWVKQILLKSIRV